MYTSEYKTGMIWHLKLHSTIKYNFSFVTLSRRALTSASRLWDLDWYGLLSKASKLASPAPVKQKFSTNYILSCRWVQPVRSQN